MKTLRTTIRDAVDLSQASRWLSGAAFAFGLAMVPMHYFKTAYVCCAALLVALVCLWFTSGFSHHLGNQQRRRSRRLKRKLRNVSNSPRSSHFERLRLFFLHSVAVALICSLAIAAAWAIRLEQNEYELSLLYGKLYPANDADPFVQCSQENWNIPGTPLPTEDEFKVFLGDTVLLWGSEYPVQLFGYMDLRSLTDDDLFAIDQLPDGSNAISTDLRDLHGKLIARIRANEFSINSANSDIPTRRRPDRSTLALTDEYGDQVLYARFLNKHAMKITGTFHFPSGVTLHVSDRRAYVTQGANQIELTGQCHYSRIGLLTFTDSGLMGWSINPYRVR